MFSEGKALAILKKKIKKPPETLMILGSGWKSVADLVEEREEISYQELFGVGTSVPGHVGKLVVGRLGGKTVALMVGRFHLYEGYTAFETTMPIRVLARIGVKQMIVTAAVGALNPRYKVGDLVILSDLLTLLLQDRPLSGPQFLDMSAVFDEEMREAAKTVLKKEKVRFWEGVYGYYSGPNFETPTDKKALRLLGADVVGMSTVPEVMMGLHLGLKILGLSFVTNLALVKHDHREVLREAERGSEQMKKVLAGIVSVV
ncbi:MAG: purine-nucleoside phosphorylase [Candidatus Chisholmbacteria bacterium]|nr:purine-nucleoside phosphorylase [Candidatus Chisholmbacteria bacterium]